MMCSLRTDINFVANLFGQRLGYNILSVLGLAKVLVARRMMAWFEDWSSFRETGHAA